LLGAITESWVDYLTRVEALRVSIGLEAYAQRDPLVQYKGKASDMFQTLLTDIRSGVIGRIFLYQPRVAAAAQLEAAAVSKSEEDKAAKSPQGMQPQNSDQKRKRHRH
jgi:preprotein translocase subunit SecA